MGWSDPECRAALQSPGSGGEFPGQYPTLRVTLRFEPIEQKLDARTVELADQGATTGSAHPHRFGFAPIGDSGGVHPQLAPLVIDGMQGARPGRRRAMRVIENLSLVPVQPAQTGGNLERVCDDTRGQ